MIKELKLLLIDELNLEGVLPDEIDEDGAMFGDGLGLDSIDALEIAVILDQRYGIKIKSGDDMNEKIFSTPRSLANFIESKRAP